MGFAHNLKYIKEELGVSNYQLAKWFGCSQSSLINWLDGGVTPHTKTRKKIADHFGITLTELDGDVLPTLSPKGVKKEHPANSEVLLSQLPESIQQLVRICVERPELASALLSVAQQIEKGESVQA